MDWRLKCAAFHVLKFLPRSAHTMAQRRFTGRYLLTVTDEALRSYQFHLENFAGGVALEFGSGSNLLTPLLLSASGATVVYALDISRLATVEQVNHVIRQLRGRVAGSWPELSTLDDLERVYRVRYRAPGDVRATGLDGGSVDFICSTSVLEHVPVEAIRDILKECKRILSSSGALSFIVDYHDHYASADPHITRFHFYRYSGLTWRFFNPSNHFQNRLRHSDFERLFAGAGFAAEIRRAIIPPDSPVSFDEVAPEFRRYARDDLAALNGFFVLRCNLQGGHNNTVSP